MEDGIGMGMGWRGLNQFFLSVSANTCNLSPPIGPIPMTHQVPYLHAFANAVLFA